MFINKMFLNINNSLLNLFIYLYIILNNNKIKSFKEFKITHDIHIS